MAANGGSATPEALEDERCRAGLDQLTQPALFRIDLDRSYSSSRHAPAWPKIGHRNPRPPRRNGSQWSSRATALKLLLWLAIPVLFDQDGRLQEVSLPQRVQSS